MEETKKFQVGDRVVQGPIRFCSYEDNAKRGTVVDPTLHKLEGQVGSAQLCVKWDSTWMPGPTVVLASSLLPEAEANEQLAVLDTEFAVIEDQVKAHMQKAADSILEVQKLLSQPTAKKLGLSYVDDMHEAISPLLHAMDAVGWRTSSLSC